MLRRFFLLFLLSGLTLLTFSQTRNLEFYLDQGIKNSPLLNDYRNQISSAVSDSLLISAGKKPLIEARSQLLYSPYYHNFGYDEVVTDGGTYTGVVGVTQYIFNKKELTNRYKAVDLQKQVVDNSTRITITELNKIITDQYLTSFSDYTDFQFNKNFLTLLEKENEIVKEFVKSGIAKQTDYLTLLLETQTQEILISQLQTQYKKDLTLLNQVCGLTDTSWYELDNPIIKISGSPDITKSPGLIQYKIDSLRIENEKMALDVRYKPKVSWFADAGFLTSNPWNFYKHFGYSAGLSLNIPLYDGKQKVIEKQKLELNENTRQVYQSTYHNQYFQKIQQLENELSALNEMSARIENQLKTSDQLVKALKDQLETGIIEITEYINAIKNFKTTSRNMNVVNFQKLMIINEMNFLLTR
jgi:outer membrane protein TolC